MGQYKRIAKAIEGFVIFLERMHVMEVEPEHSMGLRQFSIICAKYILSDAAENLTVQRYRV